MPSCSGNSSLLSKARAVVQVELGGSGMSFLSFSVFPDMGKGGADASQGQEGGQGEEGEGHNRPCSRQLSVCEVNA